MPDSRLSRLAARGDARAFEAIFKRHHQELYRYCRAILGDPDDAQDALQATMAAALRALPGEQREIELRPWLYRVAHNEAITIARRRRDGALPEEAALTVPGADVAAADRERLRALVGDLSSLPERQRGAIVMRELSGLSYGEIAAALDTSQATARQTVYEAREAMRDAGLAREADCAEIRQLISARDGRVLRGRKVRAHLRSCDGCGDYLAGISQRRLDLELLAPPLPAAAAGGLLAALSGEGGRSGLAAGLGASGSTGGAGGVLGVGGALAGSSALGKGGAILAALAVGAGAVSGAVDLPFTGSPGEVSTPAAEQASPRAEQAAAGATDRGDAARDAAPGTQRAAEARSGDGRERAGGRGAEAGAARSENGERGVGRDRAAAAAGGPSQASPQPPAHAGGPGATRPSGAAAAPASGATSGDAGAVVTPAPGAGSTSSSGPSAGQPADQAFGQARPDR